jgi:hypothetical protein
LPNFVNAERPLPPLPAYVKAEAKRPLTKIPVSEKGLDAKASQELVTQLRRSELRKHRALKAAVDVYGDAERQYAPK